jgi:hypothetical protein
MVYNEDDYEKEYEVQRMVLQTRLIKAGTLSSYPVGVPEPKCYCPTLQMAMKWLREVHNIHIIIHRYPVKLNYSDVKLWYSEIITLTSPESVDKQFFLNEENDTYEAACESAIKYCLNNLI